MDHFGLRNQKDLPQLKDIQSFENSINPEDSNLGYETISSEEALEIELREDDTVAEITEESNESSTSENTDTTETATETEE